MSDLLFEDLPVISHHISSSFADPDQYLLGQLVEDVVASNGYDCTIAPAGAEVFVGANDFGDVQLVFLERNTAFRAFVPRRGIVPAGADASWCDD